MIFVFYFLRLYNSGHYRYKITKHVHIFTEIQFGECQFFHVACLMLVTFLLSTCKHNCIKQAIATIHDILVLEMVVHALSVANSNHRIRPNVTVYKHTIY